MREELVSIIVPIYNTEQYLDECIKSMVEQTYRNLEIILIDDGSGDKSGNICKAWAEKDERIRYIYQENRGVGAARNRGLQEAHGEYLSFVDADDMICETFCRQMADILLSKNADIVYCNKTCFYEDGRREVAGESSMVTFTWKNTEYECCDPKGHYTASAAIYKREVLEGLFFQEDLYVGEDTVFFSMAVRNANVLAFYDAPLYHYRILEVSSFHGPFTLKKYTAVEAWMRVCEVFHDWPLAKLSAQVYLVETCNHVAASVFFNASLKKIIYKKTRQIYWANISKAVKYYLIKGKNPLKCIVKGIFPWLYALYLKIFHIKL